MAELLFHWEKQAAKQEAMPDGLDPCEQQAFHAVSMLYARYKARQIDKDTASDEKRKIKLALLKQQQEMDRLQRKYSIDCKYEKLHKEWKEKVERYIDEYRKATSDAERLATAERLVMALDGAPVGRIDRE